MIAHQFDENVARAIQSPDGIERYRRAVILAAMKLYLRTGIKANTSYTPQAMRNFVAGLTGKPYRRSRNGLYDAHDDLVRILNGYEVAQ